MATTGVYVIINVISNKFYVGSSLDIERRWKDHKKLLKSGRHSNRHLLSSYNKHGLDAFKFFVLEETTADEMLDVEQKWLDLTKCYERKHGYNHARQAKNRAGWKHTAATKEKMSACRKGKPIPWLVDKPSGYKGKTNSPDTIHKQRHTKQATQLTYQGKTQFIAEWAKDCGIKRTTLSARLFDYGWNIERALTTPVGGQL